MHLMIDLETMGTRPDAPIMSIGAVAFDGTGVHRLFYRTVSLQSSVESGATIDPQTVEWWLSQSDDARAALVADISEPLPRCLADFSAFVSDFDVSGVWGNGASFDNTILAESYKRLGMEPPWPFWKDRCYRTIKSLYPDVELRRDGTHHNALDDAKTQAHHLIQISAAHGAFL